MNTKLSALLLSALCAAALPAQQESKTTPKASPEAAKDAKPESQGSDESLIQQLGDADYQVRKRAEDALRKRGQSALGALSEAAKSHADEEVRWRSRRLAKQIEGGESGGLRKRADAGPDTSAGQDAGQPQRLRIVRPFDQGGVDPMQLDKSFNQMFERMEREFGIDIPRQRFFQNDFFKDLERQMEQLHQGGGTGGAGHSMQMSVGPDGVKVKVEEKGADGKAETKTYEAPSLEEFRSKYPDIAKQYLDGGGMRVDAPRWRVFSHGNPGMQNLQIVPFGSDPLDVPEPKLGVPEEVPAGERLGVYVEPIGDELREHLGLSDNQGLRVKETMVDSLGARLGLEAGDIVLEIGKTRICGVEDVRAALRDTPASSKVEVKVVRKGKELTLSAEKPASTKPETAPSQDSGKELRKKGKKKTEIR